MKKINFSFFRSTGLVVTGLSLVLGAGFVFAAPSTPPSSGTGVLLPINQGPDAQTKTGGLTVSGALNLQNLCINGDCQSTWASGGSTSALPEAIMSTRSQNLTESGAGGSIILRDVYRFSNGRLVLVEPSPPYYFRPISFSLQLDFGESGKIISVTGGKIRCYTTPSDYSYLPAPTLSTNTPQTNSSYFVEANDVTYRINGRRLEVDGWCAIGAFSSAYLSYGIVEASEFRAVYEKK